MFMADDMAAGHHSTGISPPSRSTVAPCSQVAREETMKVTKIRHVLDLAVADDTSLATELRADLGLRLSGPLDLGADAPPLPLGLDQRRMDAVDPNAILLAEVGEALGEGGDGGVDRAADGESPLRPSPAGSADRDQRAAALLQKRPGRAREPHMGEKFQRITIFPIGIGQRQEIAALGGAGIVDQNVESAEFAPHRRDQRLDCARLAQVERHHRNLASFAADRLRNVVERACVTTGEHEIAALLGESESDAAADAATRSGHERDLSLQAKLHSATPLKTRVAL